MGCIDSESNTRKGFMNKKLQQIQDNLDSATDKFLLAEELWNHAYYDAAEDKWRKQIDLADSLRNEALAEASRFDQVRRFYQDRVSKCLDSSDACIDWDKSDGQSDTYADEEEVIAETIIGYHSAR